MSTAPDAAATPNPAATVATQEEPRSIWVRLWLKVLHFLSPPANATVLREMVEELIEEPLSQSGMTQSERMLLGNIVHLREKRVGSSMVPRAEIVAIDVNAPVKDLVDLIALNNYSRIPVYRDTLDDVIGMVHVKDLTPCLAQGKPCLIADLVRPVLYVAPSMSVSRLLLQMRQARQHMALVIDEFGGIDGLVTIEDLVEEIIGEIDDEHDAPEPPSIITRADGTLLTDARLDIDAFEQQTGLTLPRTDGNEVDTLGGYVIHLAGRIPHVGESFTSANGLIFDVLETDQTRVSRLRIRKTKTVAAS